METVVGSNVRVSTDETGGIVAVEWDCPHCEQFNAGLYFLYESEAMQGDFAIQHACEDCGATVIIECWDAQELF